jgi:hypothetical protein
MLCEVQHSSAQLTDYHSDEWLPTALQGIVEIIEEYEEVSSGLNSRNK